MAAVTDAAEPLGLDIDALMRPFEEGQIKQRPGKGKRPFSYVSGSTVIDRLLEATAGSFSWRVEKAELVTQETPDGPVSYWVVQGSLAIRGLGVRAGIGTHPAESVEAPKAAETDALKRAAVKFGVGLHLYEDDAPSPGGGGANVRGAYTGGVAGNGDPQARNGSASRVYAAARRNGNGLDGGPRPARNGSTGGTTGREGVAVRSAASSSPPPPYPDEDDPFS